MDALLNLLSKQEETLNLIRNLSAYVIYFYPGMISLYVTNFLEAKNVKENTAYVIKMFAISYLYNLILGLFVDYKNRMVLYNAILISLSFIIPLLIYKLKYSSCFSCLCSSMGIRTCVTGVPFELIKNSDEKYTCVKVYLKDNRYAYVGYMQNYEYERNSEDFLILTGYKKYAIKGEKFKEKQLEGHRANNCNEKVYIKCNEIKVIEKISENRATNDIYTE